MMVGLHRKTEFIIVDLLNSDDEIQTKFSIYNLGGPAFLCAAREEDLLMTSGFTENGSYAVMIVHQSHAQWSLTAIRGLVHICLRAQQSLHHFQVPILGGPVQWSPTIIIGLVHICLHAQQSLHHLQVPIWEAQCSGVAPP